jgi:hypothetical protein
MVFMVQREKHPMDAPGGDWWMKALAMSWISVQCIAYRSNPRPQRKRWTLIKKSGTFWTEHRARALE